METSNYYKNAYKKDKIVIHHTAGSHQPLWTIDGWQATNKKIGTAFIIGGKSNDPKYPDDFDGAQYKYFDPKYWSLHLGIKEGTNYPITKASIGIELCNYGQLIKNEEGRYLTRVNSVVPEDQVVKCSFRGYEYYEAYTVKQVATLKKTLLALAEEFNIDIRAGIQCLLKKGCKAFELQTSALAGKPGLWTHVNYRKDKWDCSPQDILIEMIMSL